MEAPHPSASPSPVRGFWARRIERRLADAGIRLNGTEPDGMTVHDPSFFRKIALWGTLGFGESYMDGGWDSPALERCLEKLLRYDLDESEGRLAEALRIFAGRLINRQSPRRAFVIGRRHYDRSPALFEAMLDSRLLYSCGYWKTAQTLEEAQEAKCDLICRKLDLKPGLQLLDIGCGFGGLARYAADRFGVNVHGITVSRDQYDYACRQTGSRSLRFDLMDYRELKGSYDRVVSVGMFEHVGAKNYRRFFQTVRQVLRPDGLFLLHSIGGNRSRTRTDPWIERYIFPNSLVPSAAQITRASEALFVLEDWHNFGADYEKTLRAWHQRFESAWPALAPQHDERFHRMWRLYLLASAVEFKLRKLQLWQLVLSPHGVPGGYRAPR
jgi:cyclopropane-fatty-acyl-phospholipid synthase